MVTAASGSLEFDDDDDDNDDNERATTPTESEHVSGDGGVGCERLSAAADARERHRF